MELLVSSIFKIKEHFFFILIFSIFFLFFSLFHLESFQIIKIAFVFILKCFIEIDENICGLNGTSKCF